MVGNKGVFENTATKWLLRLMSVCNALIGIGLMAWQVYFCGVPFLAWASLFNLFAAGIVWRSGDFV